MDYVVTTIMNTIDCSSQDELWPPKKPQCWCHFHTNGNRKGKLSHILFSSDWHGTESICFCFVYKICICCTTNTAHSTNVLRWWSAVHRHISYLRTQLGRTTLQLHIIWGKVPMYHHNGADGLHVCRYFTKFADWRMLQQGDNFGYFLQIQ